MMKRTINCESKAWLDLEQKTKDPNYRFQGRYYGKEEWAFLHPLGCASLIHCQTTGSLHLFVMFKVLEKAQMKTTKYVTKIVT